MNNVRFRDGEGFQGKCERCLEWWPIDGDFWDAHRGVRRCRACHIECERLVKRLQRLDPAVRKAEAEKARRFYAEMKADQEGDRLLHHRLTHAARQRVRYHTDPVFRAKRLEQSRAYAAANRERVRAKGREWYQRQREKAA